MHKLISDIVKLVTSCYNYGTSPVRRQVGVPVPAGNDDKEAKDALRTHCLGTAACLLLACFCSFSVLTSTLETANFILATVFFFFPYTFEIRQETTQVVFNEVLSTFCSESSEVLLMPSLVQMHYLLKHHR